MPRIFEAPPGFVLNPDYLVPDLEAQRDALLEALQALYDEQEGPPLIRRHRQWQAAMDKARAAIAKAEGENHAKNL